jgi:TDG/mug DNA glycosylase family protein
MREVTEPAMTPALSTLTLPFDGGAPLALADLHRRLAVGDRAAVTFLAPPSDTGTTPHDVLEGAGFSVEDLTGTVATVTRLRTLSDLVAPDLRVLLSGLNPSPYAADVGVGFARPGNRFWPAALASGLVTVDRDPRHALVHHGVGMTDLVKRATARADELDKSEFRHGGARLERLVGWLRPQVLCVLGVTGWRAAVDRHAAAGWQPERFGGVRVYVMANPSGLNAHATPTSLAAELLEVQRAADMAP